MRYGKLYWLLLGLALLTPLGLLAPGTAWGEWSTAELLRITGYVPAGLAAWSDWWRAPLPDYTLPGSFPAAVSYILTAVLGAAVTYGAVVGGFKLSRSMVGGRRH